MTNPAIIRNTKVRTEEFLLSEASGNRSRDNVKFAANVAPIQAGTVMGKVTATGFLIPYLNVATDGSQQAVGIARAYVPISAVTTNQVIFSRDCEVDSVLVTGLDAPGIVDLLALGVVPR